jgi:hypothetical protein
MEWKYPPSQTVCDKVCCGINDLSLLGVLRGEPILEEGVARMAKVRVREREREVASADTYELALYYRKKFVEKQMTGKVVIHEKDREWEPTRQGRIKYYLDVNAFSDHAIQDWQVFKQDIRKHSGSHKHQGGLVIFCLEGKGYSVVDGKRKDWEEGDMLLLPLEPGGIEHQHFNLEPGKPCKWIAYNYWPYFDLLASEMTQGTLSPDYSPR